MSVTPFDPKDAAERYAQFFAKPGPSRFIVPAVGVAALVLFVFGLYYLDFSLQRIVNGAHQLGWIVLMMLPPDPGSSLPTYLAALGETLSIALLGTTLAAIVALPLSLLAARNIIPSWGVRFPVRRSFDTIRGIDSRRRDRVRPSRSARIRGRGGGWGCSWGKCRVISDR